MTGTSPAQAASAQPDLTRAAASVRHLRTADLLVLSVGTFALGVDGFVLSGLLPQVSASLHVSVDRKSVV